MDLMLERYTTICRNVIGGTEERALLEKQQRY